MYADISYLPAVIFGKQNEARALDALGKYFHISIKKCGLFIHQNFCYLGASPDGLVSDNAIAEVKCIYGAKETTPEEAICRRKLTFWKKDGSINKNHQWYFQIQGQLEICDKNMCYFGTWTKVSIKCTTIERDRNFWKEKMEGKLVSFYNLSMLPEMIDSRFLRNMEMRD